MRSRLHLWIRNCGISGTGTEANSRMTKPSNYAQFCARQKLAKKQRRRLDGGLLMNKTFAITLFMLATLAWATAQQPGSNPRPGSGQAASPNSQMPGSSPSQGPVAAATVVEGCLGGSNPNYTITDSSGVTYKLNIPPTADASKLAAHVGESVNVMPAM